MNEPTKFNPQELSNFDAKVSRWALLLAGPLWMGVALYKLSQPEAVIAPAWLLFGMGVVAFSLGIYTWRHR